jgi:hypothetical protein
VAAVLENYVPFNFADDALSIDYTSVAAYIGVPSDVAVWLIRTVKGFWSTCIPYQAREGDEVFLDDKIFTVI